VYGGNRYRCLIPIFCRTSLPIAVAAGNGLQPRRHGIFAAALILILLTTNRHFALPPGRSTMINHTGLRSLTALLAARGVATVIALRRT
jgi:hypothetical protein